MQWLACATVRYVRWHTCAAGAVADVDVDADMDAGTPPDRGAGWTGCCWGWGC